MGTRFKDYAPDLKTPGNEGVSETGSKIKLLQPVERGLES